MCDRLPGPYRRLESGIGRREEPVRSIALLADAKATHVSARSGDRFGHLILVVPPELGHPVLGIQRAAGLLEEIVDRVIQRVGLDVPAGPKGRAHFASTSGKPHGTGRGAGEAHRPIGSFEDLLAGERPPHLG